jgi:hypothetical protein
LSVIVLTVLLAAVRPRRLPWWSPVLVAAGFVAITVHLDLLPVGGALLALALLPMARAHVTAPAATEPQPAGRVPPA